MIGVNTPQGPCGHCGNWHSGPCPRVKAIEYFPNGLVKRVEYHGYVADGQPHTDAVEIFLYNEFPFHGRGWTHIAWSNVPDNPEQNNAARYGKIEHPKPYNGK